MVTNNCHNRDSWEELREPGEDKTGDLGDIFLPRRGGTSMCDVCPENKGDVGLQPCHGFKGGEHKDGRTVTAVSTRCSSTAPIFLIVRCVSTGRGVTEVAGVASNSVRELKVKVREVPECPGESLGGGCLRVFGCRHNLALEAGLKSHKQEDCPHCHHHSDLLAWQNWGIALGYYWPPHD